MEVWKDIKGYEGLYQVSNMGNVRSLKRNKNLSLEIIRGGYCRVKLCDNGKENKILVHRLVAKEFLDNPLGLCEINHKDENKLNNNVENLEYCTRRYNVEYSQAKSVHCLETNDYFKSLKEAEETTQISKSHICDVCNGKRKTAGGYRWEYA